MAVQLILKNSNVEDKRPLASQLADGELALNYNEEGAFLSCKDSAGNVQQVGGVKISEAQPSTPLQQTIWLQPSTQTLFVYDGSEWLTISAAGSIDFSALASYTGPENEDQIAILDTASNTVKKVSLEDLIAKRARDSRRIYLSKDTKANDSNNGTSPEEPLLTPLERIQRHRYRFAFQGTLEFLPSRCVK
jgi:DNA gyrase/topoisomerase IV subunit A